MTTEAMWAAHKRRCACPAIGIWNQNSNTIIYEKCFSYLSISIFSCNYVLTHSSRSCEWHGCHMRTLTKSISNFRSIFMLARYNINDSWIVNQLISELMRLIYQDELNLNQDTGIQKNFSHKWFHFWRKPIYYKLIHEFSEE